jgi:hypothetical protein
MPKGVSRGRLAGDRPALALLRDRRVRGNVQPGADPGGNQPYSRRAVYLSAGFGHQEGVACRWRAGPTGKYVAHPGSSGSASSWR